MNVLNLSGPVELKIRCLLFSFISRRNF